MNATVILRQFTRRNRYRKPRCGRGQLANLRLGIVDGCCSTTSRVSEGDLQGFQFTPDDVPSALSITATLSVFTAPSSAMLNLARVKGHIISHTIDERVLKRDGIRLIKILPCANERIER